MEVNSSAAYGLYPQDVVLTDIVMPDMEGLETIKRIRRGNPALPIIAISGGGNFGLNAYLPDAISTAAYLAACKAAGAEATLAKPFETAELRSLINQVQTA